MRKVTSALLICVLAMAIGTSGCNSLSDATRAQNAITAVLQIAKAELPAIPAQDQAAYTNWVNLGISLDTQLGTCITGVSGLMGKGAQFAACFTAFATGFLSPAELAQLRLLNPATQAKVQLYATAAITAVNLAIALWDGTAQPAPVVTTPPASSEMFNLCIEVAARTGGSCDQRALAAAGY
jgi:hypothetical protein